MVAVRNKDFRNMEFRHLLISENFLNLDTALFPTYHTDDEHWTIASVYPKSKTIVHINSKRNDRAAVSAFQSLLSLIQSYSTINGIIFRKSEWVLLSPRSLSNQQDSGFSAVNVCSSGYNFVQFSFISSSY